nr:PREDICTED: glutathione S-transferase 1 [Tribolium castaneum]|eukprot:XP_008200938.1 PREDICTED: glutathione S-transferase 1 [Tribolium castaneum]
MAPTLYMIQASPPVRAVLITAKAIGLDLNQKDINFFQDEHLKPHFLKLNPQHTIPTLEDEDGFAVWDSHAIMTYLVSKYAKDDSVYPQDIKKRAVVNQRLFFESGVIFFHMRNIARSLLVHCQNFINEDDKDGMIEGFGLLEKLLEGKKWAAGDFVSLADYSLISSVGTAVTIIPVDSEEYPNLTAWMKRCEELPEYAANAKGLKEAAEMLKLRLTRK